MGKMLYRQEFSNGSALTGYVPTDSKGATALKPLFASKTTFFEKQANLSKNTKFTGEPSKVQVKVFSKELSKSVFLNFYVDLSKTDEDDIQAKLVNITVSGVKFDNLDPKIF